MKRKSGGSGWLMFWAMTTAFCSAWVGVGATAKESQQKQRTRRQVSLKEYVQLARAKLSKKEESNKGDHPERKQASRSPERGARKK